MADLGRLVIDVVAQNKQILANLNQVENRLSRFEKTATGKLLKVEGAFNKIGAGARRAQAAVAAIAAALAVREVIAYADAWRGLEGRLKLVTDSQEQLSQAQQRTFQIAQEARREIDSTVELYQKYAVATKELGTSQQDLERLTSLTAKALTVSGSSADAARAAIVQLGQGLGAGKLRGEEFNSVMEQALPIAQAIADGLNVPIGKLKELADAGELTTERVTKALLSQERVINEKFSLLPIRVEEAWTKLNNSITRFIGIADSATGASSGLVRILERMADVVDHVAGLFDSAALGELRDLSNEIVKLQKQRDDLVKNPPLLARILPEGFLQNQVNLLDVQIEEKLKRAQELRDAFARANPDAATTTPPKAPPAFDLSGLVGKGKKKGRKGPDFEAIRNRFAEEAARRELQLQREIADATGRTSQFQIAALAEIEAARQTSIHQARGDAVALAAIERTAALERQNLEIEVTQRTAEEQQRRLDLAKREADQRVALIELAATAQRTELQIAEQQGAFALQIAEQRGASVEQLVSLYQQQAGIVQRLGQVESDNLSTQIAATQEVIARVRERYATESALLAQLEAQRAKATDTIEQGVLDARIRILRDSVDQVGDSYLDLVGKVSAWSDQQKQTEAQVRESLRRIGQDLQDLQAPVSQRVWEEMGRDAQRSADRVAGAWVNAFDQAADGLAEFVTTGKGSFKELLRSIETDLLRTINKEIFKNLFGQLLGVGQTAQPPGLFASIIDVISKSPRPAIGAQAVQTTTATPLIQFPLPTVQPPLLPPDSQLPQTADIFHGLDQQLQAIAGSVGRIDTLSQTGIERIGALGGNALQQLLQVGSNSLQSIAQVASQALSLILSSGGASSGGGGIFGSLFSGLGGLFGAGGGGGGAIPAGTVFTAGQTPGFNAPFLHDGNLLGARQMRAPVAPELFLEAPKLHDGLSKKIKGDEFPAILQQGEIVLSRQQSRAAKQDGSLLKVPILHGGNLPGARQMRTPVAPELFMEAPKLHGGLMPELPGLSSSAGGQQYTAAPAGQTARASDMLAQFDRSRPKTATQRGMSGETHVHNWNITTPDVNSFQKARGQVQAEAARQLSVANRRNN